MASRVRVKINRAAKTALLKSDSIQADLDRRGQAIADACNADSSWGGYKSGPAPGKTAKTNVWSIGDHDRESRQQRLPKNLDQGK